MKTFKFFLSFALLLCISFSGYAQSQINDADGNTSVETNRSGLNDDIIWLQSGGIDRLRINGSQLQWLNSGGSIFIGDGAGANDDLTNNLNVFLGDEAGTATTSGAENVALGRRALFSNTTGAGNMAVGSTTLYRNTTGGQNAGIGKATLFENTTGSRNVGIGFSTLRNATTADDNVAIGSRAGFNTTIGAQNVLIGTLAGFNNQQGGQNVMIGYEAGRGPGALHSKSGDVFIGYQAGYNETTSNKLYIENSSSSDPLIWGDFATDQLRFNGTANVTNDLIVGSGPAVQNLTVNDDGNSGDVYYSDDFPFLYAARNAGSGGNWGIRFTKDDGLAFEDVAMQFIQWGSDGRINLANTFSSNYSTDAPAGINLDTANHVGMGDRARIGSKLYVVDSTSVFNEGVIYAVNDDTQTTDKIAVRGTSTPADGYGYGVHGTGGYRGGYFLGQGGTYTGAVAGIYGVANGSAGTRYGVYGSASGGTNNWGGYFPTKVYATEMRVGGTTEAVGYKLMVDGKAICEELKIQNSTSWPDYVFANDYELKSLEEVEAFINKNKHLPNIPSAAEIDAEDGFMVGAMQNKTIEKVEELTLYAIDANKRIKDLEAQNEQLAQENAEMKAMMQEILQKLKK